MSADRTLAFVAPLAPQIADGGNTTHVRWQVFNIFFAHLTTSITEVEIYLNTNETVRDVSLKFSEFQKFVELKRKEEKEALKASKKAEAEAAGKKPRKKKSSKQDKLSEPILEDTDSGADTDVRA